MNTPLESKSPACINKALADLRTYGALVARQKPVQQHSSHFFAQHSVSLKRGASWKWERREMSFGRRLRSPTPNTTIDVQSEKVKGGEGVWRRLITRSEGEWGRGLHRTGFSALDAPAIRTKQTNIRHHLSLVEAGANTYPSSREIEW